MRFQGGKHFAGDWIVGHLVALADGRRTLLEPFVGGASVTARAAAAFDTILASDSDVDLVLCWIAAMGGWVPPVDLSETAYKKLRTAVQPSPLRGFASRACAFGGRRWSGYARSIPGFDFPAIGSRSVVRKAKAMGRAEVAWRICDYREWTPQPDWIVYADPPYANTSRNGVDDFDHGEFWATMEKWAAVCPVLVSEYQAPKGWTCVDELTTMAMRAKTNVTQLEKLWTR